MHAHSLCDFAVSIIFREENDESVIWLKNSTIVPGHTSSPSVKLSSMSQGFDKCKERPSHIEEILNGLNRYNPETTTTFQEYVNQQCEEKFFDTYACLALLKL